MRRKAPQAGGLGVSPSFPLRAGGWGRGLFLRRGQTGDERRRGARGGGVGGVPPFFPGGGGGGNEERPANLAGGTTRCEGHQGRGHHPTLGWRKHEPTR